MAKPDFFLIVVRYTYASLRSIGLVHLSPKPLHLSFIRRAWDNVIGDERHETCWHDHRRLLEPKATTGMKTSSPPMYDLLLYSFVYFSPLVRFILLGLPFVLARLFGQNYYYFQNFMSPATLHAFSIPSKILTTPFDWYASFFYMCAPNHMNGYIFWRKHMWCRLTKTVSSPAKKKNSEFKLKALNQLAEAVCTYTRRP